MVNEIKYYGCPIINAVTPTSLSKRINDQEEKKGLLFFFFFAYYIFFVVAYSEYFILW